MAAGTWLEHIAEQLTPARELGHDLQPARDLEIPEQQFGLDSL